MNGAEYNVIASGANRMIKTIIRSIKKGNLIGYDQVPRFISVLLLSIKSDLEQFYSVVVYTPQIADKISNSKDRCRIIRVVFAISCNLNLGIATEERIFYHTISVDPIRL